MTIKRYFLAFILIALSVPVFSQTKDSTVFLKWKLKPGEVITYKTEMKEIDTANHKDFNFGGLARLMGVNDKTDSPTMEKMIKDMNKEMEKSDFISRMSERRKGIIDIELSAGNNESDGKKAAETSDPEKKAMKQMVGMMTQGVMLRGSVYEDGSIESFYTKNDQRNLLSIFFELPAKGIKVGDSWALDVHLLSADQYFVCDSSIKRNKVTLVNIENINGDHIATLKYDILEYMNGDFNSPVGQASQKMMMKMTHQAIARFSIDKGRWIFYEGIMSLSSSGLMTSQTTKKLSLVAE